MQNNEAFFKSPSAQEFIREIRDEFLKSQRPTDQIIMDETAFCDFLKISKRKAIEHRKKREITYSKLGGKIYYKLSDVLDLIEKNKIKAIDASRNIFNRKIK